MTRKAHKTAVNWKYFEASLPALRRIPAERLRELRALARPGETWHQVIARVNGQGGEAFKENLPPCRLCQSTQGYQTFACKQMGICDACNAQLEAEMVDPAPSFEQRPHLHQEDLVESLGPGWKPCAEVLPWADFQGLRDYVVYSPDYAEPTHLPVCRFSLTGARWWSPKLEAGISGVTHWRLALPEEKALAAVTAPLPGPTYIDETALERLRRWWGWFRLTEGYDDE